MRLPGVLAVSLAVAACGAPAANTGPRGATNTPEPPFDAKAAPSTSTATEPTVADALAFLDRVDAELRRLWIARDRAGWVSENFITDDTEAIAADAETATAAYVTLAVREAARFQHLKLPEDAARKLMLLRLAQTVPAPDDAVLREE